MQTGLEKTRVLVTGASGGIGQAIARQLDDEGVSVVLHCHQNLAGAEELAHTLAHDAEVVQADLRDEAQVESMYAQIATEEAVLDAVVVNAGIWIEDAVALADMSVAQWERTMAADLTSAFLTCRGFFRHLRAVPRDDASVVLIGSTAGLFGEARHCDYAAAKSAMAYGMTSSLKNEIVDLAVRGRVNCVCPGWVRTPMAEGALADPQAVARATATVAMRKVADPSDIAKAVVYLCSPALSGHVTGAILPVHGGMEGRLLHPA